jgi:hypothetical protein
MCLVLFQTFRANNTIFFLSHYSSFTVSIDVCLATSTLIILTINISIGFPFPPKLRHCWQWDRNHYTTQMRGKIALSESLGWDDSTGKFHMLLSSKVTTQFHSTHIYYIQNKACVYLNPYIDCLSTQLAPSPSHTHWPICLYSNVQNRHDVYLVSVLSHSQPQNYQQRSC